MSDFIVTFEFMRQMKKEPTPDHEPWVFEDLVGGFWVVSREDLRPCRPSQGKLFIPASCLRSIELR